MPLCFTLPLAERPCQAEVTELATPARPAAAPLTAAAAVVEKAAPEPSCPFADVPSAVAVPVPTAGAEAAGLAGSRPVDQSDPA